MAVLWIANPQTLREAALTRNILVGTAVRPSLFSEAAYSATLGREFNIVQAEDVMKWWTVRHTAGAFDFREGDQVVQFALAHRMKVRGHCWSGITTIRTGWRRDISLQLSYPNCYKSPSRQS